MHTLDKKTLLDKLNTSIEQGLTSIKVQEIQETYGKNTLPKQKGVSIKTLVLNQLQDTVVRILLIASTISFVLGEHVDAYIILIIVILNGLLGFFQEYKAEKGIQKLLTSTIIQCKVLRDGKIIMVDSKELVPGDVVLLEAGDRIAADMRLRESNSVQVDESLLTGESIPVSKDDEFIGKPTTILAEQKNMCFAGTSVTKGSGKAIVVKTGISTQLGSIVSIVQAQTEGVTPLQKKLARFSKQVGIIVGIISLGIFALGRWQGKPIYDMFFIVVSLAVSSIPEGLIAVVTITLALSTQKLFKQKALVRKIKSIESLGTTTVICTDKTGTLTQNHMTVTDVFIGGNAFGRNGQTIVPANIHPDHFNTLCEIITYCNNAALPNVGDPTEIALLEMTKHMQLPTKARIGEIPFDSDTKYMVTQYAEIDFMKGSVEHVLKLCDTVLRHNEIIGLSQDIQKKILEQNDSYARSAIRVLGCAYKDKQSEHYTFVGMVGMIDPPREEVPQAIQECYDAGIRVIMITGDHLLTAQAIAAQIGLTGQVMEGSVFEQSENKLEILQATNIFARVTPAQKVMICEGLKQLGHHVIMTGDGVNDAAALKAADIGFAMGITGTEVTKDASDIVLLDDNFATIVNTIREGRVVYANIKKFIKFMLAVNFDEMIRVVFNFFVGLPVPMTAIQILRINLVTDSLPTLALGFDEGDSDIMKQKPRDPKESLLHGSRIYIIGASVIAATIGIGLFIYKYNTEGLEVARTMSVVSAVCFEMFLIFSVRDVNKPLWRIKPNRYLIGSVLLVLTLQFTVIYSTRGRHFDFVPLSTKDILICIGAGLVGTLFFELKKLLLRKRS